MKRYTITVKFYSDDEFKHYTTNRYWATKNFFLDVMKNILYDEPIFRDETPSDRLMKDTIQKCQTYDELLEIRDKYFKGEYVEYLKTWEIVDNNIYKTQNKHT